MNLSCITLPNNTYSIRIIQQVKQKIKKRVVKRGIKPDLRQQLPEEKKQRQIFFAIHLNKM